MPFTGTVLLVAQPGLFRFALAQFSRRLSVDEGGDSVVGLEVAFPFAHLRPGTARLGATRPLAPTAPH